MKRLLRIDSSTRGADSHSRSLANMIEAKWAEENRGLEVIRRDLSQMHIPHINQDYIEATFVSKEDRTPAIDELLALSDGLIAEMKSADTVLISLPMFNFSIPSVLKAYIDYISRFGETFLVDERGYTGLLSNKKLVIACAYASDNIEAIKEMDCVGPYLKVVFGFLGFDDIQYLTLGGTGAYSSEVLAAHKLELIKGL